MTYICKTVLVFIAFMSLVLIHVGAQTACPCEQTIDNSFQVAPMTQGPDVGVPPLYENDNAATPAMALPFHFCFYGQSFDSVYIGNKGIVTFKQPIYRFDTSGLFPLGHDSMIIAPFWADAYTLNNFGVVYYKITPTHLVVIWDSVRYEGSDVDGWNTFQLIITDGEDPLLPAGSNIEYCYPIMQWSCSDSSGGFSGYGGAPATVGINKGDGVAFAQIATFSKPGNSYYGPFSPNNGVDWLDYNSFTFNTCVNGSTIAPVIFNDRPQNTATLYICPCDTTSTERAFGLPSPCDTLGLTGAFICAEPGQTAVLSYDVTGPLNFYELDTATSNFIDSITAVFIPAYGDTGTHEVTITATDPVSHLQSSVTYTVVVTTNCLADTTPVPPLGINSVNDNSSFSVYPNPTDKNLTVKLIGDESPATIKIFDLPGNEVYSAPIQSVITSVDVSQLSKGIYFARLFRNNVAMAVVKIVIQ